MSSRARSARNLYNRGMQEVESKDNSTSGTRTPLTAVGRGWHSSSGLSGGETTPGPRGILKSSASSTTAISPPPIPPITATSGTVPAEWVCLQLNRLRSLVSDSDGSSSIRCILCTFHSRRCTPAHGFDTASHATFSQEKRKSPTSVSCPP